MKHHHLHSFARIYSAQPHFTDGTLISVEVDITQGLHAFSIVGLPNKATEEARDRVGSALKNSGFSSPKQQNKKIVVSLAPAELKKEGSCFDVAIAIGYLVASKELVLNDPTALFVGELSLDGTVRPVREVFSVIAAGTKEGVTTFYVPKENTHDLIFDTSITLYPIESIKQLVYHLDTSSPFHAPITPLAPVAPATAAPQTPHLFDSIVDQSLAKRALEIAIAGGHNILFIGPPGTGKTLLAKSALELMPELTPETKQALAAIHGTVLHRPPFRNPHHTSSYSAIIGNTLLPGEITRAHKGILFLDELPEFDRRVIESLRQPLEDRSITISRIWGTQTLPVDFILIATMNPCPCGYFGSTHHTCTCTPLEVARYRKKVSGPILDRIDLWVPVENIAYHNLSQSFTAHTNSSPGTETLQRINTARALQEIRYHQKDFFNAHVTAKDLALLQLSGEAQKILDQGAEQLKLSPRAYHRVIKVARTIADLAEHSVIEKEHLLEALQFRNLS